MCLGTLRNCVLRLKSVDLNCQNSPEPTRPSHHKAMVPGLGCALARSGAPRDGLGLFGALWGALGLSGAFWSALGRSGAVCGALGRSVAIWTVLERSEASWGILGRSGALWGVLVRSGAFWCVLGRSVVGTLRNCVLVLKSVDLKVRTARNPPDRVTTRRWFRVWGNIYSVRPECIPRNGRALLRGSQDRGVPGSHLRRVPRTGVGRSLIARPTPRARLHALGFQFRV